MVSSSVLHSHKPNNPGACATRMLRSRSARGPGETVATKLETKRPVAEAATPGGVDNASLMCSEETPSTGFLDISTQCLIDAQIEATRIAGNVSGCWSFSFVWSSPDGDIF